MKTTGSPIAQLDRMRAMDDASFLRLVDGVLALPSTPANKVVRSLVIVAAKSRLGDFA